MDRWRLINCYNLLFFSILYKMHITYISRARPMSKSIKYSISEKKNTGKSLCVCDIFFCSMYILFQVCECIGCDDVNQYIEYNYSAYLCTEINTENRHISVERFDEVFHSMRLNFWANKLHWKFDTSISQSLSSI